MSDAFVYGILLGFSLAILFSAFITSLTLWLVL